MSRNRIYIVGFMGSGKTTAGKNLASLLGWTFKDLDKTIEEKTGWTIPEIFAEQGEAEFRRIETATLRELESCNRVIISTGGGAPCHDDNMEFMLTSGITIYLKLTPEQLCLRLADSKTERPLIKGLSEGELLTFIEGKLSQRQQFYERAEIILSGWEPDLMYLQRMLHSLMGSR